MLMFMVVICWLADGLILGGRILESMAACGWLLAQLG